MSRLAELGLSGYEEQCDRALLARLQDRFERAWERAETLSALR
ncbi:hypothetical protein [Halobacterium salinarum]|nr:hypothetical protein [Halobacterium salinarum]